MGEKDRILGLQIKSTFNYVDFTLPDGLWVDGHLVALCLEGH
jgi:hypothetical protein